MDRSESANEGGSSPETVIARSSSEEGRKKQGCSTSGEYVTVAGSSSSLDTLTSVPVAIPSATATPVSREPSDAPVEKKKGRFGALKSSFRKEGGLFKMKGKNRDDRVGGRLRAEEKVAAALLNQKPESEGPVQQEPSGTREQQDGEHGEASTTETILRKRTKKKIKSRSLVRKLSLNKFRSSVDAQGRSEGLQQQVNRGQMLRGEQGGDTADNVAAEVDEEEEEDEVAATTAVVEEKEGQSRQSAIKRNKEPEDSTNTARADGPLGERSDSASKLLERPASTVTVVQRKSPSLIIRSFSGSVQPPASSPSDTSRCGGEDTSRSSTLPYAIAKWSDRQNDRFSGRAIPAFETGFGFGFGLHPDNSPRSSPLEVRRKLSLLEEKRAIFQRRFFVTSRAVGGGRGDRNGVGAGAGNTGARHGGSSTGDKSDSRETVIAVTLDDESKRPSSEPEPGPGPGPEPGSEPEREPEGRSAADGSSEPIDTTAALGDGHTKRARQISVRKFDTFSTFEGTFDEETGLGYLAGIEEGYTEGYIENHESSNDSRARPKPKSKSLSEYHPPTAAVLSPSMGPSLGGSAGGGGGSAGGSASGEALQDKPQLVSQESTSSQNSAPNAGLGEKREHLYKILVIGELGAGKTSIIKRYVHQFFSQHYRATIGVDFALKVLNWDPQTIIRLQLWDIAGQERFGNMTRVYYKEAVGAFIVFDVTRSATLDAVVKWKQDLDSKIQLPDGSPIPCVLLANKCDQQKEGLVNTPAKMDEYCNEKKFAGWFETSAKENINIEEAARFLVNKILQNEQLMKGNGTSQDQTDGERFALNQSPSGSKKNCSC